MSEDNNDYSFYAEFADELGLSSDFLWDDDAFALLEENLDNGLEDFSAIQYPPGSISPRRIHSPSLPVDQPQNHPQPNMPNGIYQSPTLPRRQQQYEEELYSDDPFRPLSSHSNTQIIDLTDSPPLQMAKRKLTGAAATSRAAKRARLSRSQSVREATEPPKTKYETVDLTLDGVDTWEASHEKREKDAQEAQKAKELAEKRPKLATIECVICLEHPTDLVVTHCGHLFCSECLHNALESGPGGSRCPSCRSKIVTTRASNGKDSKQSYCPLEIQLKISTKSGKRKA